MPQVWGSRDTRYILEREESVDELWLGVKCHSNPELACSP
ncbi:hypothetical protein Gotur_015975 [Gossypium turneri]